MHEILAPSQDSEQDNPVKIFYTEHEMVAWAKLETPDAIILDGRLSCERSVDMIVLLKTYFSNSVLICYTHIENKAYAEHLMHFGVDHFCFRENSARNLLNLLEGIATARGNEAPEFEWTPLKVSVVRHCEKQGLCFTHTHAQTQRIELVQDNKEQEKQKSKVPAVSGKTQKTVVRTGKALRPDSSSNRMPIAHRREADVAGLDQTQRITVFDLISEDRTASGSHSGRVNTSLPAGTIAKRAPLLPIRRRPRVAVALA